MDASRDGSVQISGAAVARCGLLSVGGVAMLLAAGQPLAHEGDTLKLLAGAAHRHEDNLFRLHEGADTQALLGRPERADDISIAYLGFRFDKPWGLQRLELESTISAYRYRNFSHLNFDGTDYTGTWHWRLTPWIGGKLMIDRRQLQSDFYDNKNLTGVNTRTVENRRFEAETKLAGGWQALLGVTEHRLHNSQAFAAEDSTRYRPAEAGLKYLAASGAFVALVARSGRGEYVDRTLDDAARLDTGYEQREGELRVHWPLGGKSELDGRVSRLRREHDHFADRDYSGTAGRVEYVWSATEKWRLQLNLRRDLASYQERFASYYIHDSITLVPSWRIAPKLVLSSRLEAARRNYLGPVVADLPQRQDRIRSAELGLEWTPRQPITLSLSLKQDRRRSSDSGLRYVSGVGSLSLHVAF
jgi:exopolysaccharide biosynthesis operon protein EpsL